MSFPYDPQLAAIVAQTPTNVTEVIAALTAIDALLDPNRDGLAWFNSLYLEVTKAVAARIDAKDFSTPAGIAFIAALDIQFANLYLSALRQFLATGAPPKSWAVFFEQRANANLARIQFALAGVNAHINRDLCVAIVTTARQMQIEVSRESEFYRAYNEINTTLDALIETAKKQLMVRLPGDPLPAVMGLEMLVGSWSIAAARESAWANSEILWTLHDQNLFAARFLDTVDKTTSLIGKTLLVQITVA